MEIVMMGTSFKTAPLEVREKLTFTKKYTIEILKYNKLNSKVFGVILLTTCNRCEIYFECEKENEAQIIENNFEILEIYANTEYEIRNYFQVLRNEEAVKYICEVACGVHSMIIHDNQIITQVRDAAAIAQSLKVSSPRLNKLFQISVTAGKYSVSHSSNSYISNSASKCAILDLEERIGDLKGKKILIIGNGKMGRLAAQYLLEKNATVYMTLRTYKHGNSKIPSGTVSVNYNNRYEIIEIADAVISATSSPHFTIKYEVLSKLKKLPKLFEDIALPRDIDPKVATMKNTKLINLDDLKCKPNDSKINQLKEIAYKFSKKYFYWENVRENLEKLEEIKDLINYRLQKTDKLKDIDSKQKIIYEVSRLTCEILLLSQREKLDKHLLEILINNIKKNSR